MAKDLERSFERFRRKGDMKALARVFDATGQDLLRIAQHLVKHVSDAEDLVQSTFLTAIDKAERYEYPRPLRPWLAGILSHKAGSLLRTRLDRRWKEGPADGDSEPAMHSISDPVRSVSDAETRSNVCEAIERLPKAYRAVLKPYLLEAEQPQVIAQNTGQAPGTVRTQIHRGLERLRKILPASVIVGALSETRGLAAVRTSVLQHASVSTGAVVATGTGASTLLVGGMVMTQKLMWTGGAVLLAGVAYMAIPDSQAIEKQAELAPATIVHDSIGVPDPASLGSAPMVQASEASEIIRQEPSIESSTRTVVRDGRLWVHGFVPGLLEEHREGLSISAVPVLTEVQLPSMHDIKGSVVNTFVTAPGSRDGIKLSYGSIDSTMETRTGYTSRQESYSREITLSQESGSESSIPFTFNKDGELQIDVTEFVKANGVALKVGLAHPLYFSAFGEVTFTDDALGRALEGEDSRALLACEMEPAAVLSGKVKFQGKQQIGVLIMPENDADGEPAQVLAPKSVSVLSLSIVSDLEEELDSLQTEYSKVQEEIAQVWANRVAPGREISFTTAWTHKATVALFEHGAKEPLAVETVSNLEDFRLKVRKEGSFQLVIIQDGFPVFNYPVHLELRQEKSMEDAFAIEPNEDLSGYLQSFPGLPVDGLPIVAERIQTREPIEVNWNGNELVWDGPNLVLRKLHTTPDESGQFEFKGVSPGSYRVSFDISEDLEWLVFKELRGDHVEARTPAKQLALSMQAALLTVMVNYDQPEDPENPVHNQTLYFFDTNMEMLADTHFFSGSFDINEPYPLLIHPNRDVRIAYATKELTFVEIWSGNTGPASQEVYVPLPLPPR